jgi:hypothetical protein
LIPSFLLLKNRDRERERVSRIFRPHSNMLYMKEGNNICKKLGTIIGLAHMGARANDQYCP